MSYVIPTLSELYAAHLSRLETALGQISPTHDKAFLKILAASEAGQDLGLYKLAVDRAKSNLAIAAIGADLDLLGKEYSTVRKQSQAAILTSTLNATTGTIIPATTDFISDANGLRYRPVVNVTAVAGVATLSLKCVSSGSLGNLDISDTFQISSQIAGAETVATVTVVDTVGVDIETDADYRPRVLFAMRAVTGGANATDHKIWSESVTGVAQAFPYAGRPVDEGTSYPGDRQVYIEATTDIDADGYAPQPLLDDVRDAINYDISLKAQPPLGITDATLFLRSISRTSIFVEVRDLIVDADKESSCKAAISAGLALHLAAIKPFVDGVDLPQERTDSMSSMSIGRIVQDAQKAYGATSSSVGFGLAVGVFLTTYTLGMGELTKLGGVAYA